MLKIAICEDDKGQQKHLENLISEMGLKESISIHKFCSGEELIHAYKEEERYSIIMLDMQLLELDGIQTAEIIRKCDNKCLIIIITSIMEYAIQGYAIDAYDFILKPVGKDKFMKIFSNAIKEIQVRMNKSYVITARDNTMAIRFSDIHFFESDKKRTIMHTNEGSYTNNVSISRVEIDLVYDGFIRISRYYLVNVYHIKRINVKTVTLTSGEILNYGNKYYDNIKREYMKFMMEGI